MRGVARCPVDVEPSIKIFIHPTRAISAAVFFDYPKFLLTLPANLILKNRYPTPRHSHGIASHRIASHRIASHRIASHRIAIAFFLLVAAVFKARDATSAPSMASTILLVALEVTLALWLLLGRCRRASRLAAMALFVAFAGAALAKGLLGHDSCGCFGRLPVSPWLTLGIDVAALGALCLSENIAPRPSLGKLRFTGAIAALMAIAGIAAWGVNRSAAQSWQMIDAENWVGKRLPLLSYIDRPEQLVSGSCVAVLYHHDCEACQQVLSSLRSNAVRAVFVELPPYGPSPLRRAMHVRLSDDHQWIAESPLAVRLQEGTVVEVIPRSRLTRSITASGRPPGI
jgi:hypothetical protein